jgi:hypothetical protein
MSWRAKTARPAAGVCRTSNSVDVGRPAGRSFDTSVGGVEERDDGREVVDAVWMDAGADGGLSLIFIFVNTARKPAYRSNSTGILKIVYYVVAVCEQI